MGDAQVVGARVLGSGMENLARVIGPLREDDVWLLRASGLLQAATPPSRLLNLMIIIHVGLCLAVYDPHCCDMFTLPGRITIHIVATCLRCIEPGYTSHGRRAKPDDHDSCILSFPVLMS